MCNYITRAAFNAVIAVFSRAMLLMKAGVEVIEAAIEPGCHIRFGIEDHGSDKCSGMVATLLQDLGQKREQARQRVAEVCDRVKLWIGAGENGRVRNRRKRGLRVGAFEHNSLTRDHVQIRRNSAFAAQEAHAVSASCVNRDKNDVWSFGADE